jgi:putative hemolysin
MTLWLELLLLLLLILANGIFALAEIAVVSARKTRLQQWAQAGDRQARTALDLANAPERFLSTIQVGITLVGILAGAFGGATLAETLTETLRPVPWVGRYAEGVSVFLVVLGITYLSLILGELVPKRLGLNAPEHIARRMAGPMQALARGARPLVTLLNRSSDAILWLLRVKPADDAAVTEEEIKVLIDQGRQAGMFEPVEQEMINRVFRLTDRRVRVLMTPRRDIVWLDLQDPLDEIKRTIATQNYSFFPVGEGSLDNIQGVIRSKDLLARLLEGHPLDCRAVLRQPLFVFEHTEALRVMEQFKTSGIHFALVLDEYAVIQGLVTFNDILSSIVGELPEQDAAPEPLATQRDDGSWLMDGLLPVDEFTDILGTPRLNDEEEGDFNTLGGFVMQQLGEIPSPGQHFDWRSFRIEVVDMDSRRVDKVLVIPPPSSGDEG